MNHQGIFKKKMKLFICYETNIITEQPFIGIESGFCFVGNFDYEYQKSLPKFKKNNFKAYGLPYEDLPIKKYLGIGIKPDENISNNEENVLTSEDEAITLINILDKPDICDVVWFKIHTSLSAIPKGYRFYGYDITYIPGIHGAFSIINDCMFICKWHGCDEDGTVFLQHYTRLNENGLFNTVIEAIDYMKYYLSFDWSERGEFCICEIFRKKN